MGCISRLVNVEIYKYIKYIINQKEEREKRERKYVIDYVH